MEVNSQQKILTIKAYVKDTKNVTVKTLTLQNHFLNVTVQFFLPHRLNSVKPSRAIIHADAEYS
jgi:hypothetical protein